MQKTIEQLYKGELYPSEQLDIKSEEYKEVRKAAYQAHEEFEGKLCQAMKDELAEHCEEYDKRGYELSERLQQQYLKKHQLSDDDFMETVKVRTRARDWAEEVVVGQILYK